MDRVKLQTGLHITIIGMSIYKLLRKMGLPTLPAAMIGGVVLLLYGNMTGIGVSSARAIGMYLLKLLAEVTGRTYDMLTALAIMAVLLVYSQPAYLGNAGFYLSFGAVLGIGLLYPALLGDRQGDSSPKYREKKGKCRQLWEVFWENRRQSFLSGSAITLTTLPILLWFYYEIPVYSVLLNVLILPFMSVVLLSGLCAMLVPGLGIIGTADCVILAGYEQLCELCEALPLHTWRTGRPQAWQLLLYYGIWLLAIFWGNWQKRRRREENRGEMREENRGEMREEKGGRNSEKRRGESKQKPFWKRRKADILQLAGLCMGVLVFAIPYPSQTVLTFLDVGQGDGICLQTASGKVYLIDGGSSSRSNLGEYVLKPFLQYQGISHIDAIFVSHPDSDHCSGVKELLENTKEWGISVGALVLPGILPEASQNAVRYADWESDEQKNGATNSRQRAGAENNGDEKLMELVQAAENAEGRTKTEVCYVNAGDSWQTQEVAFVCLHPPKNWTSTDCNAYSECFYVTFLESGLTMLLTGDVQEEGERLLLLELQERSLEHVDLLKVAHHGSGNSTPKELLAQLTPSLSVISCAEENRYKHPHKELLERLEQAKSRILMTKDCGAITVRIRKNVSISSFTGSL